MPHSSKHSTQGRRLLREERDLTPAFQLFKQHIQGLPLPPLEPIWAPHDPEEMNAFEQNLISIQRLYLCQAMLAKEPEGSGGSSVLVAFGAGVEERRVLERSSAPLCTGSCSTAVFQSQAASDALRGLVSPGVSC